MTQRLSEISPGYVDVQLQFAARMAELSGEPLAGAVLHYTNFHRRLGFGKPGDAPAPPAWNELVADIATLSHRKRVDRMTGALAAAGDGAAVLLPGRIGFGCFACEPPDAQGMVRIHFGNREHGLDIGPLHHTRIAARRAELAAMFGFLAREHPGATHVNGGSWLYNVEAYRRLFPADYGASRVAVVGPRPMHGLSTWGQFLDFRRRAKVDVVARFVRELDGLDVKQPWLSFPYQVLATTAPLASFRREYGV